MKKSYIVSGGKQVEYTSFEKMIGGINSEVYKVKKGGKDAVLKFYSKNASEYRQKREIGFYKFVEEEGGNWTPKLIDYNEEQRWTLLTFIKGKTIDKLSESDIDQIAKFVNYTKIKGKSEREYMLKASDNGMNFAAILSSVENRIESQKVKFNESDQDIKFLVKLESKLEELKRCYQSKNRESSSEWNIGKINKHYSPSDVGLHNTIKSNNGLKFFDFEYSGIDDKSKLICDWIHQPRYIFSIDQERQFLEKISREKSERRR